MPHATPVYLERGSKRVFACALEWPGWCRSGKTDEAALEALEAYAARYAPVAARAGVRFPKTVDLDVAEELTGGSTTDFGAPEKPAAADTEPLTKAHADRVARLVAASWEHFDDVVAGAPAELRKGPRGGGRDRDKIVEHVLGAEASYVRKIGLKLPQPASLDRGDVHSFRDAVLDTLRAARAPIPELATKAWPYRYAARRIAWHVLDHAWEIEDRSV
jgi:hypothetical protein